MRINTARSSVVRCCVSLATWSPLMGTEEYDLQLELKYESARQFYMKIPAPKIDGRDLPPIFTNIIRRKNNIECQTLELMKRNQKVTHCSEDRIEADRSL